MKQLNLRVGGGERGQGKKGGVKEGRGEWERQEGKQCTINSSNTNPHFPNLTLVAASVSCFFLLTFEKHAPMWTLGVGGSPLDTGFPPEEEDEDEESCGGVGDVEGCLSLPRLGGARGESASARRSRKKLSIK